MKSKVLEVLEGLGVDPAKAEQIFTTAVTDAVKHVLEQRLRISTVPAKQIAVVTRAYHMHKRWNKATRQEKIMHVQSALDKGQSFTDIAVDTKANEGTIKSFANRNNLRKGRARAVSTEEASQYEL